MSYLAKIRAAIPSSLRDQMKGMADLQAAIQPSLRDQMVGMADLRAAILPSLRDQMRGLAEIQAAIQPSLRDQMARMADLRAAILPSLRDQMRGVAELQAAIQPGLQEEMARMAKIRAAIPSGLQKEATRMADIRAIIPSGLQKEATRMADIRAIIPSALRDEAARMADIRAIIPSGLQDEIRRIYEVSALAGDVLTRPTLEPQRHVEVSAEDVIAVETLLQSEQFQSFSIVEKIDFLVAQAKKPESFTRKDFLLIILSIIINLVFDWTTLGALWKWITSPKQPSDAVRQIRRAAATMPITHEETKELRIVSKVGLQLFARPYPKSVVIGYLSLGQIVYFLGKRGKWSHVAIDTNVVGWTRSKYLKRLRNR
jgi:hypothetical protein